MREVSEVAEVVEVTEARAVGWELGAAVTGGGNRDLNNIEFMNDAADDTSVSGDNVNDEDEDTTVSDVTRRFRTRSIRLSIAHGITTESQLNQRTGSTASKELSGLIGTRRGRSHHESRITDCNGTLSAPE